MTVIAYLHEPDEIQLEAGMKIIAQTPFNFLTPIGINETAMGEAVAKLVSPTLSKLFEQRPKAAAKNQSETGNSDSLDKMKVMGQYGISDLDGTLRPCSGKSEGVKRMNKIGGMIRLLGWERFSKLVLDLSYSPKYFVANCQRYEESAADLPADSPIKTLGKLSHISDLPVIEIKTKLECVLLGTYPQYDRTTISLNDYLRSTFKIRMEKRILQTGKGSLHSSVAKHRTSFHGFLWSSLQRILCRSHHSLRGGRNCLPKLRRLICPYPIRDTTQQVLR